MQVIMDGARFAVLGNCVISAWAGPPEPPHLRTFDELMAEVSGRYADGVVMLLVLEPGALLNDASQRKAAEGHYARWASSLRALAQLIEGENLWAATGRSHVTAIQLVEPRHYPSRLFADAREATRWCAPHLELPPPHGTLDERAEALLACTQRLRATEAPAR
jgi:hypothetical protein